MVTSDMSLSLVSVLLNLMVINALREKENLLTKTHNLVLCNICAANLVREAINKKKVPRQLHCSVITSMGMGLNTRGCGVTIYLVCDYLLYYYPTLVVIISRRGAGSGPKFHYLGTFYFLDGFPNFISTVKLCIKSPNRDGNTCAVEQ